MPSLPRRSPEQRACRRRPEPPAENSITAVDSGNGNYSTINAPPVSVQVAPAVTKPTLTGPQVTSVERYGYHDQATYLVIYFNDPLDPTSAENVTNYTITGPVNEPGRPSQRIHVGSGDLRLRNQQRDWVRLGG